MAAGYFNRVQVLTMFEFVRHVMRNPSMITKHARRLYATRKAMREFHATYRECAWCGRSKHLEVHHIIPVSVAPHRAADKTNMIMLCRKPACHQIIGHDGDFRSRYVPDVEEICNQYRQVVRSER